MNDEIKQGSFFQAENCDTPRISSEHIPLAERCRPETFDQFFGQEEILGPGKPLRKAIERDRIPSMILWGPPGSGKTTLARLLARLTQSQFLTLSATDSGIKDLRQIINQARESIQHQGTETILFIDEIHRWNKSQQDALLPHVESGLITLIGATTENPSFEVIGALLSRLTVFTLSTLEDEHLRRILLHGIELLNQDGRNIQYENEALDRIIFVSHGDGRVALNMLQRVIEYLEAQNKPLHLTPENAAQAIQEKRILYDKKGEEHYNLISALHKSMRDSDPQATLYWLARMLEAGEDPLYIARRIIRFASEDIGLADSNALLLSLSARDAYHTLGSPEGELALAQAAVYCATAPKSNAIYAAFNKAKAAVHQYGYLPVPHHIRNAPTRFMKDLGYGQHYEYAHDQENAFSAQEHLPDSLKGFIFYEPTDRGREKQIQERMDYWKELAKQRRSSQKDS